jgi:acyl-coenzyme A thioesterase PaaI-like protein
MTAIDEARRLAAEIRRIIERLASVQAPEEVLAQAADGARSFADVLDTLPTTGWSTEGFSEAANAPSPASFFDRSPFIGMANPLAAPISLSVVEEGEVREVEGRAVFGAAYEGPPGCLHGGFVAAAFDEVLGFAQTLSGRPGMTGTLTVIYRNPTPLYTELRFRAGVDRVEGRKIFAWGKCYAGDMLTAEAEGIFISIEFERFAKLLEQRAARKPGA